MRGILKEHYMLNPDYVMLNDKKRVIITNSDGDSGKTLSIFTHPIFAMYLSFFNGRKNLEENIKGISETMSCTQDDALKIIEPLLENHDDIRIQYSGIRFIFPRNILVKVKNGKTREDLNWENYIMMPPYDFQSKRLYVPQTVLLVLNTKCVTDCIYCYADRYTKYKPLALDQILGLIKNCKEIGVRDFDISGGEIFNHVGWDAILKTIYENGYNPYISTKYPLPDQMIDKAWDAGMREIQISLDSLSPKISMHNLNVKEEYIGKMIRSIKYFDKKGFTVTLKGTITKETCTIDNIKKIIDLARSLKHVNRYTFTPAGYSHYKSIDDFNAYKPTLKQVDDVSYYLKECMKEVDFEIKIDDSSVNDGSECANYEEFRNRSVCTGNLDGVIVLPDGKVTICEELYWNDNFILGDINHNSLSEIWASEKAYNLWKLSRNIIPDTSPCKKCQDFDNCRYEKGVCWKEIIAVYGKENWLFPDPRCPKAPAPLKKVFYDNTFM